MKSFIFLAIGFFLMITPSKADSPAKPSAKDKCPVCGMFVSKYPEWIALIKSKDGKSFFFDGAKDMFKFLNQPEKYVQGLGRKQLHEIYVTDYYSLEPINAMEAFYVMGSDVLGPMGRELIPFLKEEDAKEFMRDHSGKLILRFEQVTPQVIKELD
ncbi:MAG: nitrous oxide reductase accessory protein NosL [bacterium]